MRSRHALPRGFWALPPLALLAGCFFYPLSLIVAQAIEGDAGDASFHKILPVLGSELFGDALIHTAVIAVTATAGCLVLGLILSLVLAFAPFPGARAVGRMMDTVIALPTFLVALAFTFIYGSAGILNMSLMAVFELKLPPLDILYSLWGVILAEITIYTPFVMRPLLAVFSQMDAAQIEVAASLGAGPWRIIRKVILPSAVPAMLAGGSLCLLLTVNEFGIVFFIGAKHVTTLPLLIYDKAIQQFDYTAACVIAVVNIGLSLLLYSVYRLCVARLSDHHAALV